MDLAEPELHSLSGTLEPADPHSETKEIDFSPSISPDGSRLAYATLRYTEGDISDHTYEIATQNIDGSDGKRLTENQWDDVSPAWSPDGSRIAFISDRGDVPRLHTIAPNGTNERIVSPLVVLQEEALDGVAGETTAAPASQLEVTKEPPVWSPDSTRLAFLAHEQTRDPAKRFRKVLYVVDADGANPRRISESTLRPAWSPDSTHLAFGVAEDLYHPITLITARHDGSNVKRTLRAEAHPQTPVYRRVSDLSWSPDRSEVRFAATQAPDYPELPVPGIHAVLVDGSDYRTVVSRWFTGTSILKPDTLVVYLTPEVDGMSWSPDQSRIAILEIVDDVSHESAQYFPGGFPMLYTVGPDGSTVSVLVWSNGSGLSSGKASPGSWKFRDGASGKVYDLDNLGKGVADSR